MKVLIVKLSAFGDIIHALPALDDLLSHGGIDEVHWLVDQRYRFVAGVFPRKVRVHAIDLRGERPAAAIVDCVRTLRKIRFDAVLDLQGLIKSSFLARLIGPRVYGIDTNYCREKASSWITRPVRFHPEDRHVVQQYRRVAAAPFVRDIVSEPEEPMGYAPPRIEVTQDMRDKGQTVCAGLGLRERKFVVLHVGGGWKTKRLPDQTWKAIADGIARQDCRPVFTWGSEEEEKHAATLANSVAGSLCLVERLDITPLSGMLAAARAVIGADTGVVHLAAALGAPTISFWGPSASWRSAPLGPHQYQVESRPDCGPCFKRSCGNFVCMERIRADEILETLNVC